MKIACYVTSDFPIIKLVNYLIHNNHLLNSNEHSEALFLEVDNAVSFISFLTGIYLLGHLTHLSTFFHYISDWSSGYCDGSLIFYPLLKY